MTMKKILLFITSILILSNCYSQNDNSGLDSAEQIQAELHDLLKVGLSSVDIMDDIKQNPRQAELMAKFQKGIENNYEWFAENMQNVAPGHPMPYHPNLGLSKEEYEEFQILIKDIEIASSGVEDVEIIKNDSTISFKSNGKLKILDAIKINLDRNEITMGEYTLFYSGPANIDNDKNGLKSKWKGHNWIYEFPKDLSADKMKDIENLIAKNYKFTIGKLEKNGKTFMQIKGLEINKGVKEVQFDIPIMF
ncbi:MAG: hypothetical protein Wins2KO_31850 [Winogradskyella sp.]